MEALLQTNTHTVVLHTPRITLIGLSLLENSTFWFDRWNLPQALWSCFQLSQVGFLVSNSPPVYACVHVLQWAFVWERAQRLMFSPQYPWVFAVPVMLSFPDGVDAGPPFCPLISQSTSKQKMRRAGGHCVLFKVTSAGFVFQKTPRNLMKINCSGF